MNSAIEKVKQWLDKNNQSPIDLARSIGVTKQAVYACLDGTNKFSRRMAGLISNHTKGEIKAEDLLYPDKEARQTPDPDFVIYEKHDTRPTRKVTVIIDAELATGIESIVCWTSGRRTVRGEFETALRAHIKVMELLELPLIHPATRQVIIKKAGEKFPPPIYAEPVDSGR
jgi:hypothetical protein